MTNDERTRNRIAASVNQLKHIRAELHQAVNAISLRDRVKDIIDVLEYLITERVTTDQPNVLPGTPAALLEDHSKTRVEFTAGPGAVAAAAAAAAAAGATPFQPGSPFAASVPSTSFAASPMHVTAQPGLVNTGDVNFIPGPPPGSAGVVGSGQRVEYIKDGVHVDANGVPIGGAPAPALPAGAPANLQEAAAAMPIPILQAGQ